MMRSETDVRVFQQHQQARGYNKVHYNNVQQLNNRGDLGHLGTIDEDKASAHYHDSTLKKQSAHNVNLD